MFAAIIVLHVICSIALICIVLLQAGKGVGIANVFGGAGQTVFGARTGDVLARATEICAGLFMATSVVLAILSADRSSSVMHKRVSQAPVTAPISSPEQQQASQQAAEKMRQTFAGIAQAVKQAAQASAQKQGTETAPAASSQQPTTATQAAQTSQTEPEEASATPAPAP